MNAREIVDLIDRGLTMQARLLLIQGKRACASCGALWPVASDTMDEPFKHCPNCKVR